MVAWNQQGFRAGLRHCFGLQSAPECSGSGAAAPGQCSPSCSGPTCTQGQQRQSGVCQHLKLLGRASGDWCCGWKAASTRAAGAVRLLSPLLCRDTEVSYCRVVSHYCPEGWPRLAVAAGSLVCVLGRGAEGWATAVHGGQVRKQGGLQPIPTAEHSPACEQQLAALSTFLRGSPGALQAEEEFRSSFPPAANCGFL